MLFIDNNDSVFCIAQICRQYTRGKKPLFKVARLRGDELSAAKHPPVPHRKVPFWNDAVNRLPIWDDAVNRMPIWDDAVNRMPIWDDAVYRLPI